MRHRRLRGKLGVKSPHRKALLRNLVRNLVISKSIRTTLAKAKVASAFADSMVELAKRGDLHARRTLISKLGCSQTAHDLITKIAPHFKERKGGYTRVLRVGGPRVGDGAQIVLLQFTELIPVEEKPKKPKKEKASKGKEAVKQEEAPKPPKEKAVKPKAKEPEEKKASTEAAKPAEKKESEKKGGFLSALRRFLKGDEESH